MGTFCHKKTFFTAKLIQIGQFSCSTYLKNRFSKNATPCLISKIGTWLDNLQDGVGIAIYSNGDRFEGVWREGQLVLGFGFKTEKS